MKKTKRNDACDMSYFQYSLVRGKPRMACMRKQILSLLVSVAILASIIPSFQLPKVTAAATLYAAEILAGANSSFALREDGALLSWGHNQVNFLAGSTNRRKPGRVDTPGVVWAGQAGSLYFVLDDGSLWTYDDRNAPIELDFIDDVKYITGSYSYYSYEQIFSGYGIILKNDGSLWGIGLNRNGQMGDGTTDDRDEPYKIMDDVADVVMSKGNSYDDGHVLAVKKDGTLWAWGANRYGQVGKYGTEGNNGNFTYENVLTPVQIRFDSSDNQRVKSISATTTTSFAVRENGTLWAWGRNQNALFGDGETTPTTRPEPTQIMSINNVNSVSAGTQHVIALTANGNVYGWGNNNYGQIGDGDELGTRVDIPKQIISGVNQVAVGDSHTLALKNDKSLWAWGYNNSGQIGNGTTINAKEPVEIVIPQPITTTEEFVEYFRRPETGETPPTGEVVELSSEIRVTADDVPGTRRDLTIGNDNILFINDGGHLILDERIQLNIATRRAQVGDWADYNKTGKIVVENGGRISIDGTSYYNNCGYLYARGGPLEIREGGVVDLRGGVIEGEYYTTAGNDGHRDLFLIRGDLLLNDQNSRVRVYGEQLYLYDTGRIIVNGGRVDLELSRYTTWDYSTTPGTPVYHYFTNEGTIEVNGDGQFNVSGCFGTDDWASGFINKGTITLNTHENAGQTKMTISSYGNVTASRVNFYNEGTIDIKGTMPQATSSYSYAPLRITNFVTLENSGVINIDTTSIGGADLNIPRDNVIAVTLNGDSRFRSQYIDGQYVTIEEENPKISKLHNIAGGVININNTEGTYGIGVGDNNGSDNYSGTSVLENDGIINVNNTGNSVGIVNSCDMINNGVINNNGAVALYKYGTMRVDYTGNAPSGNQLVYSMTVRANDPEYVSSTRFRVYGADITANGVTQKTGYSNDCAVIFYMQSGDNIVTGSRAGYLNASMTLTVPTTPEDYNALGEYYEENLQFTRDPAAIKGDFLVADNKLIRYIAERPSDYANRDVIIPADLGITRIDDYAFCYASGYIGSVSVPAGVTSIGRYAFSSVSSINSITLPRGLITIEDYAFNGIYNLKNINIPSTVTTIGVRAFSSTGLESVTVPGGVKEIGEYTFNYMNSLKWVRIEEGVEEIGDNAFSSNSKMEYAIIPESVTKIDDTAFRYSGNSSGGDRPYDDDESEEQQPNNLLNVYILIYCVENSFAHKWAEENGIKFSFDIPAVETTEPPSTTSEPSTTTTAQSTTTGTGTIATPASTTTGTGTIATAETGTDITDTFDTFDTFDSTASPTATTPPPSSEVTLPENIPNAPCDDCDNCMKAESGILPEKGRILGEEDSSIFDALEILKALVGMNGAINDCGWSMYAALITEESQSSGAVSIFDALEVLKYLVGMDSGVKT